MTRRPLVSLGLALCLAVAMLTSVATADARQSACDGRHSCASDSASHTCGDLRRSCSYPNEHAVSDRPSVPHPPGLPGAGDLPDPRDVPDIPEAPDTGASEDPLRNQLDVRTRTELAHARQRLTRAESDAAIAASRRLRVLALANLRRKQAGQLRQGAARAQRRANAAEKRMVDQRRSALEQVQARRAAYSTELLNWLSSRVGALALAVWILLIAFLAAGWRPALALLAFRRAGGLRRATYAKAVAAAAATAAGGAALALELFATLNAVLAPMIVPVTAAMVILLGLIAWRSTAVTVGSAAAPAAVGARRLAPGMAVGLMLLTGLGIGLVGILEGEPAEPRVSPRTAALARLAEPDPAARPTKRVARLRREADRADRRSRRAEARAATAEVMLRNSHDEVSATDERTWEAKRAVDRWQQRVDRLRRE